MALKKRIFVTRGWFCCSLDSVARLKFAYSTPSFMQMGLGGGLSSLGSETEAQGSNRSLAGLQEPSPLPGETKAASQSTAV